MTTQTQKIAERKNDGTPTGNVFELVTWTTSKGKEYMFSFLDGEFGSAYSVKRYKRLPSQIKALFS